ncbi:MAG: hypothetical protein JXD21_06330 [Candidatus Omnitrophica bacterium]|nr:hypothetical protein [Candidatus Omnitrophota bacterium]
MKAVKGNELFVTAPNEVGTLEDISERLRDEAINVRAVSAYVVDDKAYFRIITSDNNKAKDVLTGSGCTVEIKEVVIVEMPDKVGELCGISLKLKNAGVDLKYIYGSTSSSQNEASIIFSSDNNDKALEILSK